MGKKYESQESVIAANTHRAQGKHHSMYSYVMPTKICREVDYVPPDEEAERIGVGALSNLPQYHKVSMC